MKISFYFVVAIFSISPYMAQALFFDTNKFHRQCDVQNACVDFSVEDIAGVPAGCDAGKSYKKVCANFDMSKPGCSRFTSIGCVASEVSGQQCNEQEGFEVSQFAVFEAKYYDSSGHKECQTVEAGKSAHFLFTTGYDCSDSYSDPNSGATCAPRSPSVRHCISPTSTSKECVWEVPAPVGNGGGEPHFQTFDGTRYDYHGECDLVMARSPSFGDVGLDLHIRTKKMGTWSLISNAALRIGDDVFEFENDGSHYINGKPLGLPFEMASRYTVTKERTIIEREDEQGNISTLDKTVAKVDLGNNRYIRFTRLGKGIMFVKIDGYLHDSEGMLGIHGIKGMVGRDRQTILSDPNEMGAQWQVRDTEPMLFRESRAPQYPDPCIPPDGEASRRRLRMSTAEMNLAVKTCEPVADEFRSMCIDDVLLSGDADSADAYLFGEAF